MMDENEKIIPEEKEKKAYQTVLRFMVCSDTHINDVNDEKLGRIEKLVKFAYDEAEKDESHPMLDAVLFAGDVTNRGKQEQFDYFSQCMKNCLKEETSVLAIAARNHDSWDKGKISLQRISTVTGKPSDFDEKIGGCHIIGISTSRYKRERYGIYQYFWLKKQLANASADGIKPIFVCQHEHVRDTVYGSSSFDGWGVKYFRKLYDKYPRIIHLSGHSHYPLNDPRSIWQGGFTAIGTGAVCYAELTVDRERTVHPEMNEAMAQAWLIEVDSNGVTRLRGYEVVNNEWLCEYIIDEGKAVPDFDFTPEKQEAHSKAPVFPEGTVLHTKVSGKKLVVTCPRAYGESGDEVFRYKIEVESDDGKITNSDQKINDYWIKKQFEFVTFNVKAKSGSTVRVWAENAYGKRSQVLTQTVNKY